jgi:hypothetical protein
MGCDIHLHVERRANGTWTEIESERYFYDGRNYGLFFVLAGVPYDDLDDIAAARGLPADMSETVAEHWEQWSPNGHSPSWLPVPALIMQDWGPVEDRWWVAALEHLKDLAGEDGTAMRIVFWFDK